MKARRLQLAEGLHYRQTSQNSSSSVPQPRRKRPSNPLASPATPRAMHPISHPSREAHLGGSGDIVMPLRKAHILVQQMG
jgi:hypothetical protein